MKTQSSGKKGNSPKRTTATGQARPKAKSKPAKPAPDEDKIREKANEIYFQRIEKGEPGNALDDWYKAEALLRESE